MSKYRMRTKTISEKWKFGSNKTRLRKNYEWIGKTIYNKNPVQKIEKNSKNQSEIAACEQKTTNEKANFCSNTVLSLN